MLPPLGARGTMFGYRSLYLLGILTDTGFRLSYIVVRVG